MLRLIVSIFLLFFSAIGVYALNSSPDDLNIYTIQKTLAIKGHFDKTNNNYKIVMPRIDLNIVMNGMQVTSEMASWVTFKKVDNQVVALGDLILLQDQVNPVMSVALANNFEVTDLQSPFLWDSPRVSLMHIKGEGSEYQLAKGVKRIFAEINHTKDGQGDFPIIHLEEIQSDLSPHRLQAILGSGSFYNKNGVYKFVFSNKKLTSSWTAFTGNKEKSIVEGSTVVPAQELKNVLLVLRKAQFFIVAIYRDSMKDDANYIHVHYWGIGNSAKLAKAIHQTFVIVNNADVTPETPVKQDNPILLPIVQNNICGFISKKWAKELFPLIDISKTQSSPRSDEVKKINSADNQDHYKISRGQLIITRNNAFSNNEKFTQYIAVSLGVEYKDALYKIPSGLMHDLLAAQNKDYDYVKKIIASSPVFSAEEKVQLMDVASNTEIFNTNQLAQHLAVALKLAGVNSSHMQVSSMLFAKNNKMSIDKKINGIATNMSVNNDENNSLSVLQTKEHDEYPFDGMPIIN